jgi:uncharacterized repeat protein (TIGR03803 family)
MRHTNWRSLGALRNLIHSQTGVSPVSKLPFHFISTFLALAVTVLSAILTIQPVQAQSFKVLYTFELGGYGPNGSMVQDAAGNLYGSTFGSIFKVDPAGVLTFPHIFDDVDNPGDVFRDLAGNLYYMTSWGGEADCVCGGIYKLDTDGNLTLLHSFTGYDGGDIENGVVQPRFVSVNGQLYGASIVGGLVTRSDPGNGTIFKITKEGTFTLLYTFTGGADGSGPQGLRRDAGGNLYGVAFGGGDPTCKCGTIFEVNTAGKFKVLYTFTGGANGAGPVDLIRDVNGNFHGVTRSGGDPTCNCGVVFRLDATGKETVLHKFFGGRSGASPVALQSMAGTLYGTTSFGGDPGCGCGVLFQVGRTGHYAVLHRFTGGADGSSPYGGLTRGIDGSIYGSTSGFPASGPAAIFKLTP